MTRLALCGPRDLFNNQTHLYLIDLFQQYKSQETVAYSGFFIQHATYHISHGKLFKAVFPVVLPYNLIEQ